MQSHFYNRSYKYDLSIADCPQIVGLNTNVRFLDDLASHPEFSAGNVNTSFIDNYYNDLFPERVLSHQAICQAALALLAQERSESLRVSTTTAGETPNLFFYIY